MGKSSESTPMHLLRRSRFQKRRRKRTKATMQMKRMMRRKTTRKRATVRKRSCECHLTERDACDNMDCVGASGVGTSHSHTPTFVHTWQKHRPCTKLMPRN